MDYKLIALDIDDTLLNNDRKITPGNAEAIARAMKAGVKVILASGRLVISLKRLYDELALQDASICCSGAQVVDNQGREISSCPIEPEDTSAILELAHELGVYVHVYIDNHFCYEKHTEYSDYYKSVCGFGDRLVPNLREMKDIYTPKILMINDETTTARIQPIFRERFPHLNIGRSKPIFLEFNNPAATKGGALKALSEYYGIDKSQMIAVGDNQIDASMIKYAGVGAAVGNAIDEIKEISDYVAAADNDHDAIKEIIDKFIFEK